MKNIMDWIVSEKIAKNGWNASAIVNGLELYKISVSCKHDGCQEGHFCYGFTPAQYVQTDSGGYWIDEDYEWGACECCEGKNYAACPKCSDEARKARVRLYRDWRNAGEPSKVAFQHAINGDVIQSLPIDGALLSEAK